MKKKNKTKKNHNEKKHFQVMQINFTNENVCIINFKKQKPKI